jgi:sialic acid synthase SpsE
VTSFIAEFCQNHNGDFELLKRMIESAAESGATHGKMQTIYADTLTYRPQFESGYIDNGVVKSIKRPYKNEYDRLKTLEISEEETYKFINICNQNNIIPMTTCFVRSHVKRLKEIGFRSIKVASYDCSSFPLLREVANTFDEIVVSTGASFDNEVTLASEILKSSNFSMLHCVTIYPTPIDQLHLSRMEWLKEIAPSVGFSDHSLVSQDGVLASKIALALGANVIERHFTLLPSDQTKDGPVSINKQQLSELVMFSKLNSDDQISRLDGMDKNWRRAIGERSRNLTQEELLNRDYYRGRFGSERFPGCSKSSMVFNYEESLIDYD